MDTQTSHQSPSAGELLTLLQSLPASPAEREKWTRNRLAELATRVKTCGEADLSRIEELPHLLSSLEHYFKGRALEGAVDCLVVFAVHQSRIYKVAGTFQAFGKKLGIAKGTLYNWLHRGEVIIRICEECPGLALPEEIHAIKTIQKLPKEHWVNFWREALEAVNGVDPGADALKKALRAYVSRHGLSPDLIPGRKEDSSEEDDGSPAPEPTASLEDLDALQLPDRVFHFREKTHGLSPSRLTAVDVARLALLDEATLAQVSEVLKKMAQTNPQDWDLFVQVCVPVFLKCVGQNLDEFVQSIERFESDKRD